MPKTLPESFPRLDVSVPWLTEAQMREVDRAMVDDYGIAILQMMEHAGRNLATLARASFLGGSAAGKNVLIAAGPGGNGGGGLSGGRQLHNMGAKVAVVLTAPADNLTLEAATQLKTLRASGVPVAQASELDFKDLDRQDLVVDAIFGYSLRGDPRGDAAGLIERIVESGRPVLSNDIPSGIEATSGRVGSPAIRASATITIALPKMGLAESAAKAFVGDLYLGNIAVPPDLYGRSFPEMAPEMVKVNPFSASEIVRVW